MGEAEQSHYVAQLKAEFDSCDTSASGFLDRDQLVALCRKLQLEAELPRLLHLLLGECASSRVNFQDFKDGFVSLLSRSLDVSPSEDDSCPLEPVIPEEVKPKFVKGTKRYGRRSRPDIKSIGALSQDSEDSPPSTTETTDYLQAGVRRAKLRRSTSLESIESLKSDEETGNQKFTESNFIHKAYQQQEEAEHDRVGDACVPTDLTDRHCLQQQLNNQDLNPVLRNMDPDLDSRVSVGDLRNLLCGSGPLSCSTPAKSADLRRAPHRDELLSQEHSLRSTSPSLLTATVGQRVLSRLDDGSGCTSPEHVIALWTEEGIRNSRDILQTLDFPLEERLSLTDLTLALDNELLVSGNGIHQAALISYKNEIQHLQVLAEQACRQRDKVRADLDAADQRNLKLVREVDDRHANMETLNQSKIRELEQDFRDRLLALRCQSEQESEVLQQQAEGECRALQQELRLLRTQEEELRAELNTTTQENSRLEDELYVVKMKLADAEKMVNKLQSDLDRVLQDKFEGLDRAGAALSHEERFSEIIKQYELQCRELQDRNDELSSELELLKSQRSERKSRRSEEDARTTAALTWTEQAVGAESDCDDVDVKRLSPPAVKKKLQPVDKTGLSSLDNVSGPVVSIQTEMAVEQLKQKHEQEVQELRIQLETQVNFYERNLEMMRQNMEVERKDISQAFKLEISELEEHKAQAEQQVQQLKESLEKLQMQRGGGVLGGGGGSWTNEQERRMQRERSEMEQNFAREIGNLVERLRAEKDQLEAELKLKMDQEVMLVREQSEQQISQMKLHHAEAQRHLLQEEQQQMQEQIRLWELWLVQLEREKLQSEERAGEERIRLLNQFSLEKKNLEAQHEEKLRLLKEELQGLHNTCQTSALQMSESEASLQECRAHCAQLEDDVSASRGRCLQLEARLEEACAQLEESISFLESQEIQNKQLLAEKSAVEAELQLVRGREDQLLGQVTQLKEELGDVQVLSDSILHDRELVANKCSHISNAFSQQQAQLQARDQTISALKMELERLQETTRTRSAELESLKADRARLIQDLKDQAMAVDKLRLQLEEVTEELERRRSNEENLCATLQEERNQTLQLRSGLKDQEEELLCLRQENCSYTRLADQLSTQIVEMEEEITSLREQLRGLSEQLNDTADLVVNLRTQLNARTSEGQHLRAESFSEVERLQQALQEAQDQHRRTKDEFEEQKKKMGQQLMELETLVLALEGATHPESSHRTQVEELRAENSALQERVKVLQQDVQNLEDDVAKKKRKVEELEGEHERSRAEEERLHRENCRYREEVLELSSRNLQLSNDNAELSARLRGDEESLRMLQQRLATVSKENEEEEALVRRLQATATQQEREKVQQQVAWTQERHLLEDELKVSKQKLGHLSELEAELSATTLKLQWMDEDKKKLLRETENHKQELEALQRSVVSLQSEAELFRSRLQTANKEKLGQIQEVAELQRKLEEAHNKVEKLELNVQRLLQEKQEQCRVMAVQEEQASVSLREETQRLSIQNQELHQKLTSLQIKQQEAQNLNQEQQNLKTRLSELETERTKANEQAARADAALSLVRAQHTRQLQEVQERASCSSGNREREEQLETWLKEEQRRSQQLEETLRHQTEQIGIKQEQYEKVSLSLQQRTEDLELKLKAVQTVLQEKVQQLKEQLAKNAKSNAQLKDVYVENSQLIKALQITEQRQKHAEKKNVHLEDKIGALHRLLRQIVPAALAT